MIGHSVLYMRTNMHTQFLMYCLCIENHTLFDVSKSKSYKPDKNDKSDCNYRGTGDMKCDHGTDTICVSVSCCWHVIQLYRAYSGGMSFIVYHW